MNPVLVALLGGGVLSAGAALWAMVERLRAAKALAAADRWHNAYDLAASHASSAADELRGERDIRLEERERLERVVLSKSAEIGKLHDANAKLLRVLAAVDPAAAALTVGDVLDGVLQAPPGRASSAGDPTALRPATTSAATNPGKGGR